MDYRKIFTAIWSLNFLTFGLFLLIYGFEAATPHLRIATLGSVAYLAVRHYFSGSDR